MKIKEELKLRYELKLYQKFLNETVTELLTGKSNRTIKFYNFVPELTRELLDLYSNLPKTLEPEPDHIALTSHIGHKSSSEVPTRVCNYNLIKIYNGFITYDHKVFKLPNELLQKFDVLLLKAFKDLHIPEDRVVYDIQLKSKFYTPLCMYLKDKKAYIQGTYELETPETDYLARAIDLANKKIDELTYDLLDYEEEDEYTRPKGETFWS